jgi:hypothetical protein
MKMRTSPLVLLTFLALPLFASPTPPAPEPNAPIHNALRGLKTRLVDAMNRNDIDAMLLELHPNVVITWQNGEVSRGRDGVRAYLERMTKGTNRVVKGYHADIDVDELTTLYGENTGVAYGSSVERFDLTSGMNFTLRGRWSATMVNENGRWLLASVHASTNLFDNALLNAAKKSAWIGIAVAAIVALIAGLLIGRRMARARG